MLGGEIKLCSNEIQMKGRYILKCIFFLQGAGNEYICKSVGVAPLNSAKNFGFNCDEQGFE